MLLQNKREVYKMACYKLNNEKKTITIDTTIKPTATDEMMIPIYIKAGYTPREKSEKRAAAAKKRASANGFGKKKETNK